MTIPAIGTILPSSNRVVERTTAAIMARFPGVDSCCARVAYYGDGLGQPADGYDTEAYRTAAWHLSHARVGAVTWNGTKGAGLGLDADRALAAAMAEAAGLPATTAALDTERLLRRLGAARVGFVTPGAVDYARAAAAGLGVTMTAARGLGLTDNFAASEVTPERIAALAREVAAEAGPRPDAILLWSTNLEGWAAMAPLEAELGIPVIDSAAAGVWGALVALGVDPRPAAALGRIFMLAG